MALTMIYKAYTYNVWRNIIDFRDDDKAIWSKVEDRLEAVRIALLHQVSFEDEKPYRIEFVKKYWDEFDIGYWLDGGIDGGKKAAIYVHGLYSIWGGLYYREYIKERMHELKPYHLELHTNEDVLPIFIKENDELYKELV